MNRLFAKILLPILAAWVLAGPAGSRAAWAAEDLLCSTFPVYLFTQNVAQGRDHFRINLLIDSALGCPHDYAPTPADLERLSRARVLVINGLGLEAFLPLALRVAKPDLAVIDASGGRAPGAAGGGIKVVLTRAEATALGHSHGGPNPHLFAAPGPAAAQVRNIAEGLAAVDPEGAATYRANAARLAGELQTLAAAFQAAGKKLGQPPVIIGHGVFDYLAQELGLTVAARIEEVDGVEPSAARLTELAKLARERGVRAILVDPEGDENLARTLGAEAKVPVAVIDPVSGGPADAPLDYYQKVMLTDLDVLLKLFGGTSPRPPAETKP